ncbi:c-type cytochrome [Ilyomonas limi]|nr:c-type cytochrome [Ilyomonas limi]
MNKKLTVLFLLAAAVFFGTTAFKPKATPPDKWKNLKVLPQDISEDSLKVVMRTFNASLGVKCVFCHAMGDNGHPNFPSDDKPEKDIARYMMKMTKEINTTYFNFKKVANPDTIRVVTCYTCHKGDAHPEGIPPVDSTHMGMPPGNMPPASGMHDSTMHDSTMHKQ